MYRGCPMTHRFREDRTLQSYYREGQLTDGEHPTRRHAAADADTTHTGAEPTSRVAVRALMVFWWLLLGVGSVWLLFDPYAEFFLFGVAACAVVTAPMLKGSYEIVSPWSMLALTVYLGCGLRGAFIAYLGPDHPIVNDLFLRNQAPGFFTRPSALYLVFLGVAALAFSTRRAKVKRTRLFEGYQFGRHVDLAIFPVRRLWLPGIPHVCAQYRWAEPRHTLAFSKANDHSRIRSCWLFGRFRGIPDTRRVE